MIVGIIGLGVVGGTLKRWFEKYTLHKILVLDPDKGHNDNLKNCNAIFICIPVKSNVYGQNTKALYDAVKLAKSATDKVFIRSTVLPGTNDFFGTIAMPEFLTARRCDEDMQKLPLVFGQVEEHFANNLFPSKEKVFVSNTEAELAKFTHNCFGAVKVTYFNMISRMCSHRKIDYQKVLKAANITGFLGHEHLQVPGPDGKKGYGGACFPQNMEALQGHLHALSEKLKISSFDKEYKLISDIIKLNKEYRGE
jgi:UDPglucose 6-dehydrogenase